MGTLEADVAIVYGRVVENFRIKFPADAHFSTVIMPGFSDGHAHPQVVDGDSSARKRWRHSYDWLENRKLVVDEAAVREDVELSSRLSRLTLMRAVLEGTTMIALTGRLLANADAILSMRRRPRTVLLPTIMDRRGWTIDVAKGDYARVSSLVSDGHVRLGVFVHSLRTVRGETIREAVSMAASMGAVMGLHLGEGVAESDLFVEFFGSPPYSVRIVPVHCIDDEMRELGISCVACPATNLMLYGRTRNDLTGIAAFGSDWPLLIGTVPRHLGIIRKASKASPTEILSRATVGGYRLYNIGYEGDVLGYDESLERIMSGKALPRMVSIGWEIAVWEGRLVEEELGIKEVEKEIEEAIGEAVARHGVDKGVNVRKRLEEHLEAFEAWN